MSIDSSLANLAVNAAPDVILLLNREHRILYCNESSFELLGYAASDLVGESIDLLIPEELRTHHALWVRKYDQYPLPRPMAAPGIETVALTRSGQRVPVDIKLSPTSAGKEAYLIAVMRDCRIRREYEDKLKEQYQQLERLNRDKTRFMGILSHDMRNYLGIVRLYQELILSGGVGPLNSEQRDVLTQCEGSVNDALELLESLLDLTSVEQGLLELKTEPILLSHLVTAVTEKYRLIGKQKSQEIALLNKGCSETVEIDRARIVQVVDNLLSNAVKYSRRGTTISVTLARLDDSVRLSVKDAGDGIEPDQLVEIFNPFTLANNVATGGEKRFGLGLAIVKKIVDQHHGKVWVESERGEGSTFHVLLPLVQPAS